MSDANFNAYNWNQNQAQPQPSQDNFIYDGSGANRNRQVQQGQGQDNFIYDGSGAANNHGAWAGEHPFYQRPVDRTQMQPAHTEVSPDGRTINVFYINNAYFNGSNVNGGYDYRQNPQYNYMNYDQNYQSLRQQEAMNYYRNPMQQFEMQREQQQWRREQQILAYQNYIRQQEMMQCNQGYQNWGNAGYNSGYNPGYYQGGGGVGINLSFLFGGHHRGRWG